MPTIKENDVWITRITYLDLAGNERAGVVVGSREILEHHAIIDREHVIVPAQKGYQVYTDTGCWQAVAESKVTNTTHAIL